VRPSTDKADRRILVEIDPTGSAGFISADAVRLTALKTDVGFNNASNKPGDLRPTTPDAEFTIDAADERYEEQGNGLQWWWNRGNASKSDLSEFDLEDLIPCSVNVPQFAADAPGTYWLHLEYTGLDDAKVFIYSNKSGADNRLQFL